MRDGMGRRAGIPRGPVPVPGDVIAEVGVQAECHVLNTYQIRAVSTFQVGDVTSWSAALAVEVGGHGVVNHAGTAAVQLLADRCGLTGGLSRALARRGFAPVHDRGRVLADAAVLIADGGRVLSDLAVLRDQGELFGEVASDATLGTIGDR